MRNKVKGILSIFLIQMIMMSVVPQLLTFDAYANLQQEEYYAEIEGLALSCTPIYSVFEESSVGDKNVSYELSWSNLNDAAKTAEISVSDYWGKIIYSRSIPIGETAESTEIIIPDSCLQYGYYKLTVSIGTEADSASFAVVPNVEKRRNSKDNGFGVMASGTRLVGEQSEAASARLNAYIESLKQAGIWYVRESATTRQVKQALNNLKNGKDFYFSNDDINETANWFVYYNDLLDVYESNGIDVSFMYSGADYGENTPYTGGKALMIPTELTEVYEMSKALSGYLDFVDMIEVANEQDYLKLMKPADSPDMYASFLKAAALGTEAAETDTKVALMGMMGGSNQYRKRMYENDIEKYIDVFNFHTYTTYNKNAAETGLQKFDATTSVYDDEMQRYGLDKKYVAVTEEGYRIGVDSAQIVTENGTSYATLTDSQQIAQAQYAPTSLIESKAGGRDINLWFIHGYHFENNTNMFGTMNYKNQPEPVYSAISAMNNALGKAQYVGRVTGLGDGAYGYIFKDGADTVGCFWTDGAEQEIELITDVNEAVITDIMGNSTQDTLTAETLTLPIDKNIKYVRISGSFTDLSIIQPSNKTIEGRSIKDKADKIVIQQRFDDANKTNSRDNGYNVDKNTETEFVVRVYNFNNEAISGKVTAELDEGWTLATAEQTVDISAMGYIDLTYSITPPQDATAAEVATLRLSGLFDGEPCSDSVSYVHCTSEREADFFETTLINGYTWKDNKTSGVSVTTKTSGTQTDFEIDATGAESIWFYPYFEKTGGYDLSDSGMLALTYKFNKAASPSNLKLGIYLNEKPTAGKTKGEEYYCSVSGTMTTAWQQAKFYFSDFNLTTNSINNNLVENGVLDIDKIDSIRIGFDNGLAGSDAMYTFSVKDIGTVKIPDGSGFYVKALEIENGNGASNMTVQLENYTSAAKTADVYVALMDENNVLKNCRLYDNCGIAANSISKIEDSIVIGNDVYSINVFCFDASGNLTPLYKKNIRNIK